MSQDPRSQGPGCRVLILDYAILKSYMSCEFSTMNHKLDYFSQCLMKNVSYLFNQIVKIKILRAYKIMSNFCRRKLLQKRSNKKFDGNSNCYTQFYVECSEKWKLIWRIAPVNKSILLYWLTPNNSSNKQSIHTSTKQYPKKTDDIESNS